MKAKNFKSVTITATESKRLAENRELSIGEYLAAEWQEILSYEAGEFDHYTKTYLTVKTEDDELQLRLDLNGKIESGLFGTLQAYKKYYTENNEIPYMTAEEIEEKRKFYTELLEA